MHKAALVCAVFLGCGGADTTLGGDGGDAGNPNDGGGGQDVVVSCDGGQTSCGGKCVDTQIDPQNCGGCGVICNTTCISGVCPLINNSCDAGAQQVGDNACLTIDATSVYWASGFQTGGTVWKLPLGGGCPSMLIGSQTSPHGMASDGTNLFFANQGTASILGSIQRIPVGGGNATPIATSQSGPLDVVLDATNVYWTNSGDGSVWKSDKLTPSPIKLAGPNGQNHAAFLRVDATNVYFTDSVAGTVNKVPIATGAVTAISAPVTGAGHLAIDSTTAYFSSRGSASAALMSIALSANAGTPNQLVPSLPSLNGIETDGTSIWFAEATNVQPFQPNSGEIHRVTTAGTGNKPLAAQQNQPNCIAIDATSVYWINAGGGTISKTGK
jgi:hypothetical protein